MFDQLIGEGTAAASLCLARVALVLVTGTYLLPLLTPFVPSGWGSVVAGIQLGPAVRRSLCIRLISKQSHEYHMNGVINLHSSID